MQRIVVWPLEPYFFELRYLRLNKVWVKLLFYIFFFVIGLLPLMPLQQTILCAHASNASSALQQSVEEAWRYWQQRYREGFPLFTLLSETVDLERIERLVASYAWATHIVILGTGGSTTNGLSLAAAAKSDSAKTLVFLDNVDPDQFSARLHNIPLATALCLIISKSGKTFETLAQASLLLEAFATHDLPLAKHCLCISDPGENPLRGLASHFGIQVLDHPAAIGGRYAGFCYVGLLPAALAGMDVKAIRQGARDVVEGLFANDHAAHPVIDALMFHLSHAQQGLTQTVLLAYADALAPFSYWFRQMWAESLGKNGKGLTPVPALGTIDQHSQLQLYLDGPNDKTFTFITYPTKGQGPVMSSRYLPQSATMGLEGRTLGDLFAAEAEATKNTLCNHGRPVREWVLPCVDGYHLGALMMQVILETILLSHVWEINPFDQPAVEEGKKLTREYLQQ